MIFALIIAGVGCVQAASGAARRLFAMSIAYRVETDLRHQLFAHFQRLHFAFHDRLQTGQLMSRTRAAVLSPDAPRCDVAAARAG
jgi:ATP-binding cassette subfamily B protein